MFIIICIAVFFASCKVVELPYTRTACDPYVKTWSGETYKGTKVERRVGIFEKDIIRADSISIKSKDVAFYSTGHDNYANVGKRAFARQVAAGTVNLFQYLNDVDYATNPKRNRLAGVGLKSIYARDYFIQKNMNEPLEYLNYRNLRSMITPGTPEAKMLEKYRRSRILPRIIDYLSFAIAATGYGLAMKGIDNLDGNLIGRGLEIFVLSGVPVLLNGLLHDKCSRKLFKAVLLADRANNTINNQVHVEAKAK